MRGKTLESKRNSQNCREKKNLERLARYRIRSNPDIYPGVDPATLSPRTSGINLDHGAGHRRPDRRGALRSGAGNPGRALFSLFHRGGLTAPPDLGCGLAYPPYDHSRSSRSASMALLRSLMPSLA